MWVGNFSYSLAVCPFSKPASRVGSGTQRGFIPCDSARQFCRYQHPGERLCDSVESIPTMTENRAGLPSPFRVRARNGPVGRGGLQPPRGSAEAAANRIAQGNGVEKSCL